MKRRPWTLSRHKILLIGVSSLCRKSHYSDRSASREQSHAWLRMRWEESLTGPSECAQAVGMKFRHGGWKLSLGRNTVCDVRRPERTKARSAYFDKPCRRQFVLHESFVDDHLRGDIREFASLPGIRRRAHEPASSGGGRHRSLRRTFLR